MRLRTPFRYSIYLVFAVLGMTGAVWLVADWQKDLAANDIWLQVGADMLMIHGGTAMVALLLLGALIPLHLLRAWRGQKNRISGVVMATLNALLIATAFGLYYLGSEVVRPWMSWIHLAAGCFVVLVFPLHIALGKRDS